MKIKEKAEALAKKEKIVLKLSKSPSYGLKAVWYKSSGNTGEVWLYYAANWTEAHKRLNAVSYTHLTLPTNREE